MKTHSGCCIIGAIAFPYDASPQPAGSAELGGFLEQVVVAGKKERQARSEAVDVQPCTQRHVHIFERICQGERHLLHGGGACLTHVIAANGYGIEAQALFGYEAEDVSNQSE